MKDILIDYYDNYLDSLDEDQIPLSQDAFVQELQDIVLYDIFQAVEHIAQETEYEDSEDEG